MKLIKKILIIIVIIGIISAGYVWFFIYNKPHRDFEKAIPDISLTAKKCYEKFLVNNKIYTGKVVQISGIPKKVETDDSLCIIVFVFNKGMFGDEGIRCSLLPKYNKTCKNINLKKPVTIKGFCAGYNDSDVILNNCSFIKK